MKLVRYGEIGKEKPGLIDKSGQLRDLSGHIQDFVGDAFSPASLAKLAALDPARLPAVWRPDGSVHRLAACPNSSPSASTIPTTPPRSGWPFRANPSSS